MASTDTVSRTLAESRALLASASAALARSRAKPAPTLRFRHLAGSFAATSRSLGQARESVHRLRLAAERIGRGFRSER